MSGQVRSAYAYTLDQISDATQVGEERLLWRERKGNGEHQDPNEHLEFNVSISRSSQQVLMNE